MKAAACGMHGGHRMKPILILYATREGYTRRIAEHVAATVRARGLEVAIHDAQAPIELEGHAAAILLASLHLGRHEREMVELVKRRRAALERMPAAFISVSLSEAGAEDPGTSAALRAQATADVKRCIDEFFAETGWHPARVKPVAGAMLYTQYGRLLRVAIRWIAKRAGSSTDTSVDHEYTDWAALNRFVDEIVEEVTGLAESPPNRAASEGGS